MGDSPTLTQVEVSEQAGVSVDLANELWRLLGFPTADLEDVAFMPADAEALRLSRDLMRLGVLSPDRMSALVRTWGRSYARLAEWQVSLVADVAAERGGDLVEEASALVEEVLPRVEQLQTYIWRRHLANAASRLLAVESPSTPVLTTTVGFIDIVGYTARSRSLSEAELVAWVEQFEDACAGLVVDHGGRMIKTLGDAVLFVCDDPVGAAEVALAATDLGSDEDDPFPEVRAGLAYGEVVSRLGDIFGPTVNIASRLTSVARPCTVLVDEGAADALTGGYVLAKARRTSVKGYSRLQPYRLRRLEHHR